MHLLVSLSIFLFLSSPAFAQQSPRYFRPLPDTPGCRVTTAIKAFETDEHSASGVLAAGVRGACIKDSAPVYVAIDPAQPIGPGNSKLVVVPADPAWVASVARQLATARPDLAAAIQKALQ
jgi:hypothetical protein